MSVTMLPGSLTIAARLQSIEDAATGDQQLVVAIGGAAPPPGGGPPVAITVTLEPSTTAALTAVNVLSASTTLIAAGTTVRKGVTFYNNSSETIYLTLGATSSLTLFTSAIIPGAYYETPFTYIGAVSAIAVTGPAEVFVTELTA